MKRWQKIGTGIGIALTAALTLPIVPERLPADVWSEEEFEEVKPVIDAAGEKLNQFTFALTEAGYDPPVTYNLYGKSGLTSKWRTLLGSWSFGTSRQSTWSFGTWILPGVPFLRYDSEEETVQITPGNLEDFLSWVEEATEYPDVPFAQERNADENEQRRTPYW